MLMSEKERVTVAVLGAAALVGAGVLLWQERRPPIRLELAPASSYGPWDAMVERAQRLDINHAAAEEIERLPGIGPVTAERIVAYREAHGRFIVPDDLLAVPGIGPSTLQKLREYIQVN